MGKHFTGSLITRGQQGGSIVSFTISIEASNQKEAEAKAKEEIFKSPWRTRKYLEDGAELKIHEQNGEA